CAFVVQAEAGIRAFHVTGVQTCALPIFPGGFLDRKALRNVVFRDARARRDLNEILHPLIRERMLEKAEMLEKEKPERIIVFDIPLLYESGLTRWVRKVIVVYVPESVQIRRLMERDRKSTRLNSSHVK